MNLRVIPLLAVGFVGFLNYCSPPSPHRPTEEAAREEVRRVFKQCEEEFARRDRDERRIREMNERAAHEWREPAVMAETPEEVETSAEEREIKAEAIEGFRREIKTERDESLGLLDLADAAAAAAIDHFADDFAVVFTSTQAPSGCNCGPRLDGIEKRIAAIEAMLQKQQTPTAQASPPASATAPIAPAPPAPPPAPPEDWRYDPVTGVWSDMAPTATTSAAPGVFDPACPNGVCPFPSSAAPVKTGGTTIYWRADAGTWSDLPPTARVLTYGVAQATSAACEECVGPIRRIGSRLFPRLSSRLRRGR